MPSKPVIGPSHEALAKTVRAARHQAGYSQETFARHAGLDRSFYSAVERGIFNITLETMLRIATGLDMSLGQLCTQAGPPFRPPICPPFKGSEDPR